MPRALLVDDDSGLTRMLITYLSGFSIEAQAEPDGESGLRRLRQGGFDILVADIMMPGMDGLQLLRSVREFSQIPVLMLTARGDVSDRVLGLELGADDYLPKPFEPRELVARLTALLRRQRPETFGKTWIHQGLEVDEARHTVLLNGEPLILTTLEFRLLMLLWHHKGQTLSREQLLEHLRGVDFDFFQRSVDVAVSRLRQKLKDDPRNPRFIRTVHGFGYVFPEA